MAILVNINLRDLNYPFENVHLQVYPKVHFMTKRGFYDQPVFYPLMLEGRMPTVGLR